MASSMESDFLCAFSGRVKSEEKFQKFSTWNGNEKFTVFRRAFHFRQQSMTFFIFLLRADEREMLIKMLLFTGWRKHFWTFSTKIKKLLIVCSLPQPHYLLTLSFLLARFSFWWKFAEYKIRNESKTSSWDHWLRLPLLVIFMNFGQTTKLLNLYGLSPIRQSLDKWKTRLSRVIW